MAQQLTTFLYKSDTQGLVRGYIIRTKSDLYIHMSHEFGQAIGNKVDSVAKSTLSFVENKCYPELLATAVAVGYPLVPDIPESETAQYAAVGAIWVSATCYHLLQSAKGNENISAWFLARMAGSVGVLANLFIIPEVARKAATELGEFITQHRDMIESVPPETGVIVPTLTLMALGLSYIATHPRQDDQLEETLD